MSLSYDELRLLLSLVTARLVIEDTDIHKLRSLKNRLQHEIDRILLT